MLSSLWVYNPNNYPIDLPDRVVRGEFIVTTHIKCLPRSWVRVTDSLDLRQVISKFNLKTKPPLLDLDNPTDPDSGGGNGGGGVTPPVPGIVISWMPVEDYLHLNLLDISRGWLELSHQAIPEYFGSSLFFPTGGPLQVYGYDYTMFNLQGARKTRVLFDPALEFGPSHGLRGLLSAGDSVSFRYLIPTP